MEVTISELNDYQEKALRTWNTNKDYDFRVTNAALGACGEAGEVADMVKKAIYHGHGFTAGRTGEHHKMVSQYELAKELGDILYYLSVLSHELGYSLKEIAEINIDKLAKRYPDGFSVENSINRVDTKEEG